MPFAGRREGRGQPECHRPGLESDAGRDVSGGCRLVGDVTSVQDPAGPLTHYPPRSAVHWLTIPHWLGTHVMQHHDLASTLPRPLRSLKSRQAMSGLLSLAGSVVSTAAYRFQGCKRW